MELAVLDAPLPSELYQQIHATALRGAAQGLYPKSIPRSIDVERLKQRVYRNGPDSYLLHPADIDRIFTGVTSGIYQTAETLYCSRIGRSIHMVWQLIKAMRGQGGAAEISYEAVWATCLYLEERRRANINVSIERGQDCWWIGEVVPDLYLKAPLALEHRPSIICVIDAGTLKVLSFRLATGRTYQENIALALYDALIAQRRPHQLAIAGLLWRLPQRIMTEVALPPDCSQTCQYMGIQVETTTSTLPVLQAMRETWAPGLAGRTLLQGHCAVLLDAYLRKQHGYGPLRERERRDREYAGAVGYTRDPAWQFPLLRALLPLHRSTITSEGTVAWDTIHYTDELLAYWPGHSVTLRRSAPSGATAWVYLDGEILCRARKWSGKWRDPGSEASPVER